MSRPSPVLPPLWEFSEKVGGDGIIHLIKISWGASKQRLTPFLFPSVTLCVKSDVALDLYDFVVRRPDGQTEKYGLRAYDEVILAPMVSAPSSMF